MSSMYVYIFRTYVYVCVYVHCMICVSMYGIVAWGFQRHPVFLCFAPLILSVSPPSFHAAATVARSIRDQAPSSSFRTLHPPKAHYVAAEIEIDRSML